MAGVKRELWTGEVVREFEADDGFLKEVPDKSGYVGNDVIHLNEVGVEPNVLMNNTTYPIGMVDYADADIALALKKLETENTRIRTDQLNAVTYSPIRETVQAHARSLREFGAQYALHAFAPTSDALKTPVLEATGATDPASGRKRLTRADMINFQKRLDKAKIPRDGRILVLCPDHEADLILDDETFDLKLHDSAKGRLNATYYSFKIYSYTDMMPVFKDNAGTIEKVAWGTTPAGTDLVASVFFHKQRVIKAMGTTEMYYTEKNTNPEHRATVVGFEQRFIAVPKKLEGLGALVSPMA